MKTAGEVRLNGERTSQTAFQTRSNHQNQVVGWLPMDGYSPGGEMLVHSPRILSYLGNVGWGAVPKRPAPDRRVAAGTNRNSSHRPEKEAKATGMSW